LLRFAGPGLKLGINGELHDGGAPPPGKPPDFIPRLGGAVKTKYDATLPRASGQIIFLPRVDLSHAAAVGWRLSLNFVE